MKTSQREQHIDSESKFQLFNLWENLSLMQSLSKSIIKIDIHVSFYIFKHHDLNKKKCKRNELDPWHDRSNILNEEVQTLCIVVVVVVVSSHQLLSTRVIRSGSGGK